MIVMSCLGAGHIFEDIIRHGSHDVYWCYQFEREVSSYVNINTNNRDNETSYTLYFARTHFTNVFVTLQGDQDGYLPLTRSLIEVHKYLLHSSITMPEPLSTNDLGICPMWHSKCIIMVSSEKKARLLYEEHVLHLPETNTCCKNVTSRGIIIGPKKRQKRILTTASLHNMERYWQQRGILNNENCTRLSDSIYDVRSVLLKGTLYHIGDKVVVKNLDVEGDTTQNPDALPWKAIITSLFLHEFEDYVPSFFQAEYYDQQFASNLDNVPILHEVANMCMINHTPRPHVGDDIRPVSQIMHKFIAFAACQQPWAKDKIDVAYEVQDLKPRRNLLTNNKVGTIPPWPEVHDVVVIRQPGIQSTSVTTPRTIRGVIRSMHQVEDSTENRNYVPNLEIDVQPIVGIAPRPYTRYRSSGSSIRVHLKNLVHCLTGYAVVKTNLSGQPVEWTIEVQ